MNIVPRKGYQFLQIKKQILTEVKTETIKIKTKEEAVEETDKLKEFKLQYQTHY